MHHQLLHEYMDRIQGPDNIYYRYRKHIEKIRLQFEAWRAGKYIYDEAVTILEKEIEKALAKQK